MNLKHFVLFSICAAVVIAQDHSLNLDGTDLINDLIDGKMNEDKVIGSFSDPKSSAAGLNDLLDDTATETTKGSQVSLLKHARRVLSTPQ